MTPVVQNMSNMNSSALEVNRLAVRRLGRVVFGDVNYAPGGICGPRVQADFQLVAVHEGDAVVEIDGVPHMISAQWMGLMLPGRREFFQFDPLRTTHHGWCAVHPTLVPQPLADALAQAPAVLPLSPRMRTLLEFGLGAPQQDVPAATALLEQLGIAVLQLYSCEAQTRDRADVLPDPVLAAQRLIAAHLAEPLTVASIAHEVGVTPQYLIKLFRRVVGTTPAKYLWQLRVQRGVELLRATGLSVEQVSIQCGFQSAFHFSRLVRQRYGRSPRAMRAEAWRGGEGIGNRE